MGHIKIDSSGRPVSCSSENADLIAELKAEIKRKDKALKNANRQLESVVETLDLYCPRSLEYSGSIPGLEIAGRVIPHNGFAGGDLAIPLIIKEFSEIYLFLADSPGHDPVDGVAAGLVYQAARMGATYELELHKEITSGLMKKLHAQFYPGHTSPRGIPLLVARAHVEGEVAKVSWQSAGHPIPRIIRLSDMKFESVDESKLNFSAPIGYSPADSPDNNYTPNGFVLNKGDTALFYSDGVSDLGRKHGKRFFPQHAESVLRGCVNMPLKEMATNFGEDMASYCDADDDMTYFLIRKT